MATPLTKRYRNGDLYERPKVIEDAIKNLLNESLENLTRRANIPDTSSPDYIPSECIVHFIRGARRRDDEPMMTALLPVLLRRCESILLSKISKDLPRAEEIREEILGQFGELFAADGNGSNPNELDFFEVRFNQAFRTFRIDILREERRKDIVRGQSNIPAPYEEDGEAPSDDEFFVRLSKEFHTPAPQESAFKLEQIKQAIDTLPAEERKAVVLCHILGYEQESDDPQKRTAATICGVTGKTIRNRLRRAAARLSKLKELIQ
jgi:DNA-directed RNA polymerase specialized sigma24 family protein